MGSGEKGIQRSFFMKKTSKRTVVALIIVNIILVVVAISVKMLDRFDYQGHIDEVLITVDDQEISLREFGYYIYEVEDFVQEQALIYDPKDPKHWWNTHFSAGADSQFVCDYAKKVAVNSCIMDEIYYSEAIKQGIVLSSAEEAQAAQEASELFGSMDQSQRTATGLNEMLIYTMKKKQALASKYALFLIDGQYVAGYAGEAEKLVNWDGAYYQEEILVQHEVWTNDKILDNIVLGKITVNQ